MPIHELFELMLQKTGYLDALYAEGKEGQDRAENVKELETGIMQFENENEAPNLSAYLEEISLISDIDTYEEGADAVVLMTVHSAKGLEFNKVFLVGMEDGLFPGNQNIFAGQEEMEEERRLAYVAITRARQKLYITHADTRMIYGSTSRNKVSTFVTEIPLSLCEATSARRAFTQGSANTRPVTPRQTSSFDYSNVFRSSAAPQPKPQAKSDYSAGMQVEHGTFGRGLIIKVTPMGNDAMLEIAFDTVGTKKIMAGFAKLRIV